MSLHLQPVQVATGGNDTESQLVFHNGLLVAMLMHLSDDHGDDAGKWFLEVGFGRLDFVRPPTFWDLEEAQGWIIRRLTQHH